MLVLRSFIDPRRPSHSLIITLVLYLLPRITTPELEVKLNSDGHTTSTLAIIGPMQQKVTSHGRIGGCAQNKAKGRNSRKTVALSLCTQGRLVVAAIKIYELSRTLCCPSKEHGRIYYSLKCSSSYFITLSLSSLAMIEWSTLQSSSCWIHRRKLWCSADLAITLGSPQFPLQIDMGVLCDFNLAYWSCTSAVYPDHESNMARQSNERL